MTSTFHQAHGRERSCGARGFACRWCAATESDPADFLDDEQNVRFGTGEDHTDILASIGEMPFDRVWRNRIEADVQGLRIPFISKADLIANKRQVGRLRDLADVEELELLPEE